jgi:hypothetical protein
LPIGPGNKWSPGNAVAALILHNLGLGARKAARLLREPIPALRWPVRMLA